MTNPDNNQLQRRVTELEDRLGRLQEIVTHLVNLASTEEESLPSQADQDQQRPEPPVTPSPQQALQVPPPPPSFAATTPGDKLTKLEPKATQTGSTTFQLPEHMRRIEYWLARAGIGLLLFGVIFLFKYSIDEGWLTPWVRIGFAFALGVALIVLGLRSEYSRRYVSQLLLGGGITTFYITGFSAFQLLELVPHSIAMVFMGAVTVISFILSIRQDKASLSILGAIGGLGTPFLLYTGTGNLPGLMVYTCLVLTYTGAIYFFKGWRSLLWVSAIGGWIVFLVALYRGIPDSGSGYTHERWWLQGGLIFGWLLFWALPVIREILCAGNSERWRRPDFAFMAKHISDQAKDTLDNHVHLTAVVSPLVTLFISAFTWPKVSDVTWGWIVMAIAIVSWIAAGTLRRWNPLRSLAYTHALMGLLLFSISIMLLLEGDTLLFALAAEGALLHLLARRLDDTGVAIGAHIVFCCVGLWMVERLTGEASGDTAIFNVKALVDLSTILMALIAAAVSRSLSVRRVYAILSAVVLAGLLIRELDSYVLLMSLTAEAVILHFVTRRLNDDILTHTNHAFFLGIGVWLFQRLFTEAVEGTPIFNIQALADVIVMVVAVLVCRRMRPPESRLAYLLTAHATFLLWLLRELSELPNGQGFVSIAWGLYAITLLIMGLRMNVHKLRLAALFTLLLVVGKLFLVDLSQLATLWRIMLFLGFGGLLLLVSYHFQSLWKNNKQVEKSPDE